MNKYCFHVTETTTRTTKVRVNANSVEEAEELITKAYAENQIEFDDLFGELTVCDFDIDTETSNDDDTFDDKQYSDANMQLFAI